MSKVRSLFAVLAAVWLLIPTGSVFADDAAENAGTDSSAKASNDQNQALQFFENEATVFVVSKNAELASEAPGIVSVWSAKDISLMGYYTLEDLANITPGYGTQNRYNFGGLEVRGFSGGSFNDNNVAEMIDGINVTTARNHTSLIGEEIPLFMADHVEMLKGPASSLYGDGAFLGVMNVVTKDSDSGKDLTEVSVDTGDPGEQERIMANGVYNRGDAKVKIFASEFNMNNTGTTYNDGLSTPSTPHLSTLDDSDQSTFLYTSAEFNNKDSWTNGLKFGGIYIQRTAGWGILWTDQSNPLNQSTLESFIPFVQYNRDLNDNMHLLVSLQNQNQTENDVWGNASPDQTVASGGSIVNDAFVQCNETEAKGEYTWNPDESAHVLVGLDYDADIQKPAPGTYNFFGLTDSSPSYSYQGVGREEVDTRSAYIQAKKEFPVLSGLDAIGGIRYDETDYVQGVFSPRVGLVQKFTDDFDVKALYGTALEAPNLKDGFFGLNNSFSSQYGIALPAVVPEIMQTFEASAVYHGKQIGLTATYFYDLVTDVISGATPYNVVYGSGPGDNIIYNLPGSQNSQGVELSGEFKWADGKIFANYTYQRSLDQNGVLNIGIPQMTGAAGVMYEIKPTGTSLTAVGRYVGTIDNPTTPAPTTGLSTTIPSFVVVDLNLRQKLDKGLNATCQVTNLFNQSYTLPLVGDNNVEYPMPGIGFIAGLEATF